MVSRSWRLDGKKERIGNNEETLRLFLFRG